MTVILHKWHANSGVLFSVSQSERVFQLNYLFFHSKKQTEGLIYNGFQRVMIIFSLYSTISYLNNKSDFFFLTWIYLQYLSQCVACGMLEWQPDNLKLWQNDEWEDQWAHYRKIQTLESYFISLESYLKCIILS